MNQLGRLIGDRRTINDFKTQTPDRQIIIDAIELARWVPNHHLTQPWHFYFPDEAMINKIVELNAKLVAQKKGQDAAQKKRQRWSNMPGWLVVSCDLSSDELQQQEDYAACCCSIYALSLILWQQRIGMKWTTGHVIRDEDFYDICWLDKHSQIVVGLLWYGYPDKVPKPQPRRSVEEIVTVF